MAFRFRKSVNVMPGLKLNFSGSGISTTVGTRGASVNFSSRGTRTTLGIPGSGLSYATQSKAVQNLGLGYSKNGDPKPKFNYSFWGWLTFLGMFLVPAALKMDKNDDHIVWWFFFMVAVRIGFSIAKRLEIKRLKKKISSLFWADLKTEAWEIISKMQDLAKKENIELDPIYSINDLDKMEEQQSEGEINRIIERYSKLHNLVSKYGGEAGSKLYKHEYFVGMTREMLTDTKGEPDNTEVEETGKGRVETLIYGNSKRSGDWFVLKDGLVTKFVDK